MDAAKLHAFIVDALHEDIGEGDHSTLSCIPPEVMGEAVLKIKQSGILAGMEVAQAIFRYLDPSAIFEPHKVDGEPMEVGQTAFVVRARVQAILQGERLALNCLQRMSGIATLTHEYTQRLAGYHTRLLDTRKTTPNFRLLEKEAVRLGGGVNHRFGLYDMIMLKDNHIDYCGSLEAAIERAVAYVARVKPGLAIEVETRSVNDVHRVLAVGGVQRIMLDNFTAAEVQEAVALIAGRVETEASGGITLDNLIDYAASGVDYVSSGAIIHQARSVDLSLKAVIHR